MTNKTKAERNVSIALWVGGACLWGIVGLMVLSNRFSKSEDKTSGENATKSVAVANASTPSSQKEGGQPMAWDPQGIGEFAFTNQDGEEVSKEDLLGRPWVVGFIFTRCAGPCPRVSGQMSLLQKPFEETDTRLVTMTVDPDYDTPEILKRYGKAFGAGEDWVFLTGDKEKIYRFVEKDFKMPVEEMEGEDRKPGFEVLHTTNLLLVDSGGVVRGKYNALMPGELAKLKQDVKELAAE